MTEVANGEGPSTSSSSVIIRDGDNVVMDANGYKSLVTIKKGSKAKVGKVHVNLDPIIGQHYGVQFELGQNGRDISVKRHKSDRAAAWAAWKTVTSERNNSELQDSMMNQGLTTEHIEAMKNANVGGEAIVNALLANSETFEAKTEFSQEKYLKKKTDKYTVRATVERPTARSLAETLFSWRPERIQYMRADTLAMLLTMANVGAHGRALVLDACGGLVTGAVAERMGGFGQVCSACTELKGPATEYVRYFNFPPEVKASIKSPPLSVLLAYRQQCMADAPTEESMAGATSQQKEDAGQNAKSAAGQVNGALTDTDMAPLESNSPVQPVHGASPTQQQQQPEGVLPLPQEQQQQQDSKSGMHLSELRYELGPELKQACSSGFSSCILASPNIDPSVLLRRVMPLLAPSASFAVFSNWMQPLADCMFKLQVSKEAVALQLNESWWREYQVLPGRTHPCMMTSGTGGYVLSGTKAAP
ncbi:g9994 [Coccomyxa viridis]|uniref:tRNA (adenine(58)-N(1))-methyltransferase non-catalytic subunit TRM6 n=1 Tax=Coccomyxa viridis TaxID=1274662 RepID=A0ABP1G8V8_9CHLO